MVETLPTAFLQGVLEDVLREQGVDPDSSYQLIADIPRLWASSAFRIAVTPKGHNKLNLFMKCLPKFRAAKTDTFNIPPLFENESAFYNRVVTAFWKLGPFQSAPRCYRAICEEEDCVLVLEDLKVRGFEVRDRFHNWSFPELRLLMQEVGRFQAFSFGLKQKQPGMWEEMKNCIKEVVYGEELSDFSKIAEFGMLDAVALIHESFPGSDYEAKMRRFSEGSVEQMRRVVQSTDERYSVIAHGDIWASNIMFCGDKLRLIDWQICRCASAGLDVAYVFFTLADKAIRTTHGEELLDAYYGALAGTLKLLGGNIQDALPKEALESQLAEGALYALGHGYAAITFTLDEGPGSDENLVSEDIVSTLLVPFKRKNDRCKQRLLDMITDIIDCGYLDSLS